MKKLKIFLILLIAINYAFGQTYIKNKQEVSGTWKESGSPYIILGEAIIPEGKTLKIKPGVVVKFKCGTERYYWENPKCNVGFMRVSGTLIAKGTQEAPILFTRYDNSGNLGVVYFNTKSKNNLLSFCRFEYGWYVQGINEVDNATGVVSFYKSKGLVENCLFANNGWTAINTKMNSTPQIVNSTIVNNKYGIECNTSSMPEIVNCIIYESEEDNFYINGAAEPIISYCLIGSEFPESAKDRGSNIIGRNPYFEDEIKFDIKDISPCYKTGKDKKNMGIMYKK